MEFWKSLSGMLTVTFTSAAPEETLADITKAGIQIFHAVSTGELSCQMQISRRDFPALKKYLERKGTGLEILRREGCYWPLRSFCRRRILLAAFLLLLFCACFLPTRILFVSVEGNETLPDRLILSAAEECGIRFGASRKLVRNEKVKNELLTALPQLQWAGINTSGCRAVITVRERLRQEEPSREGMVSNLIAQRDGYILSATVTSGTLQVAPGDTVTQGQLLISGYTDCGICIRASRASGEILAQTNRTVTACMPQGYRAVTAKEKPVYRISLRLGKKRINLWKDSSISPAGCGRMYEEYCFSLPGGFRLPAALCVDRYIPYTLQNRQLPEAEARKQLMTFSDQYLLGQMLAGRILQKQQRVTCREGLYRLESSYVCSELMGRERREEIGVSNGKIN